MRNSSINFSTISKKTIPYFAAAAIFIIIALCYCSPILDSKVLHAGDTKQWQGMVQEALTSLENGNPTWWTNSMFGGMPSYQIGGGEYIHNNPYSLILQVTRLGFTGTLAIIIGYLVGFFILLKSFKIDTKIATVGAIAIALSSYYMLIIPAGHITKAETIGLMAPVIGGFYLIFQKKYWQGAIITMIYSCLGFMKHPQMSYYVCMTIGLLLIAEIYVHTKEKRFKDLGISLAIFIASVFVGIGTECGRYLSNQEYLKETMRGGHSELIKEGEEQTAAGLDITYATAWSYGIDETLTLIVPGFMGNASGYSFDKDSHTYTAMRKQGIDHQNIKQFCQHAPAYWGDQPFTAGPVYIGAIVCFLFVLGLFIIDGPYKWALLTATIFSVALSWGQNFMPLTEFFFNNFPMYNKFRAVSSILIVAEITMPLLGFLAIKKIMDSDNKKDFIKQVTKSAAITGGLCLILALLGGTLFNFQSANDAQMFSQLPKWLTDAILQDREAMLKSDAWRSFVFIAIGAAILFFYCKEKLSAKTLALCLGIAILIDMWPVNKRFFNDDNFVSKEQDKEYFKKQPHEEYVLSTEKDLNYRVMNLASNTFNDSRTSYYFKSIGGYHAAKLRRYQDLIDEHISKMNMSVLNMLNTKYFFVRNNGEIIPQLNPNAMGNGWYVNNVTLVNSPNEESDALNTIDVKTTAVVDQSKFKAQTEVCKTNTDSTRYVKLLSYAPNKLEYECASTSDGTVIFSEIYYPYGWKAYIDGKPAEHFRANYVLRAMNIPSGKHSITFHFDPDSVRQGATVTWICYFIILATIIAFIAVKIKEYRKTKLEDKNA